MINKTLAGIPPLILGNCKIFWANFDRLLKLFWYPTAYGYAITVAIITVLCLSWPSCRQQKEVRQLKKPKLLFS